MVAIVEAVRDAVGSSPTVGLDLHWNVSAESARALATRLDPVDVDWLEDHVPPEDVETHRRVTEGTDVSILTGQNLTRAEGVFPYLSGGATDLLAPDIQNCGGLLEFRKIATLADVFDVPLAPHNSSSPIGTLASVHACASVPNAFVLEWHARELDWWEDVHAGEQLITDGAITVPEEPGLGIDVDRDVLSAHLADGETLPAF